MVHITTRLLKKACPFLLVLAGLMAVSAQAPLAEESDTDAEIQETILLQIEAFANDDKESAWGYASEGVKRRFGSSDVFISMVREVYPAVHRATTIEFTERIPHGPFEIQAVRLQGPDGKLWDAFYRMVKTNGEWKVAGVQMRPADFGV